MNTVNYSYTGLGYTGIRAHTGPREFQSHAETAHCMFCTVWYSDIPDFLYIPDSESSAQPQSGIREQLTV